MVNIQKFNHTLDPEELEDLTNVHIFELKTKPSRRIHSKIILFKEEKNKLLALVRRPNFTSAALNTVYKGKRSNLETALLLNGKEIAQLLSDLEFHDISIDEVKRSRLEKSNQKKGYPYSIIRATFQPIGRLKINFLGTSKLQDLTINLEEVNSQDPIKSYHVELDPNLTQIAVQTKSKIKPGTTICFSSNDGKQLSNKALINISTSIQGSLVISSDKSIEKIITFLSNSKTLARAFTKFKNSSDRMEMSGFLSPAAAKTTILGLRLLFLKVSV